MLKVLHFLILDKTLYTVNISSGQFKLVVITAAVPGAPHTVLMAVD